MERRRLGRIGFDSTVLIYGGAMLSGADQDTADASVQEALDAGINHIDTAASYGDSEQRLGPWTGTFRERGVFLATKVEERGYDAARTSIERSLRRLRTDRVDLLQVHSVGELDVLDRVTARPGSDCGALAALLRAQQEGLTRWVGITGHGHDAPAVHREALRRHDFDAVLTPWNHRLAGRAAYREEFHALVAACAERDVALRTIKTVARQNWPDGRDPSYTTWYEPWDDPEHIDACVAFVLAEPGVCGFPSASDVRLLAPTVAAVERAGSDRALSVGDVDRILDGAPGYSSPFERMPF